MNDLSYTSAEKHDPYDEGRKRSTEIGPAAMVKNCATGFRRQVMHQITIH